MGTTAEVIHWLHSLPNYDDMVAVMGDYDDARDYVGPGESWKTKIIPRTIWGIDINAAAYIHDYYYEKHKGEGEDKRLEIDCRFLVDIMRIIEMSDCWAFRRNLARLRAVKYYAAVREGGAEIFAT